MTIELLAPAKINLGLEVIRKREDGFHDIATVFQTISVFDRIHIERAVQDSVQIINRIIQIEANLAERALDLTKIAGGIEASYRVEIEKRIPIAAGLGGASSDAAAVLRALALDHPIEVEKLALRLGSDVPFLLEGGAALASGRGELLEPIPSLRNCWLVLITPDIELERKTARLYGALQPEDFSQGQSVDRVAGSLQAGTMPSSVDLANVFSRPLAELMPEISTLRAEFENAGAPFVALSGAGPTHYTIVPGLSDALRIARRLSKPSSFPRRVLIARPVPSGLQVRRDKTTQTGNAL